MLPLTRVPPASVVKIAPPSGIASAGAASASSTAASAGTSTAKRRLVDVDMGGTPPIVMERPAARDLSLVPAVPSLTCPRRSVH